MEETGREELLKTEDQQGHLEYMHRTDLLSAPPGKVKHLLDRSELAVRKVDWNRSEGEPNKPQQERKLSSQSVQFSTSEAIRRSDNFWLKKNKPQQRVLLQITNQSLLVRELASKKTKNKKNLTRFDLDLDDIIGATVENEIVFIITTYTIVRPSCCSRQKPQNREVKRYFFYTDNPREALQWNALTLLLLRHKLEEEETDAAPGASNQRLPFAEQRGYLGSYDYINPYAQVSQLPEAATGGFAGPENQLNELPQKRKFLAIVNPFSGKQKGRALWNKAKSVLKHAHLEIEERITTSRDDAFMIAQKLIPNEYDGILTLGGDGIIHETVNGLLTRPDWRAVSRIPLAFLPGGTSDGLVASIMRASGLEPSLDNAIYVAIKGQQKYLDVTQIQREDPSKPKIYSVLSVAWAIIADIDINSQSLRCCGSARYDLYGAWRALCPKRYSGVLRFRGYSSQHSEAITQLKMEETTAIDFNDTANINDWEMRDGPFTFLTILNVPWIDQKIKIAPLCEINDGLNDIVVGLNFNYPQLMGGTVGRCQIAKQLLNMSRGDYFQKNRMHMVRDGSGVEYFRAKCWRIEPLMKARMTDQNVYHEQPVYRHISAPPIVRQPTSKDPSSAGILSYQSDMHGHRDLDFDTPKSSVAIPPTYTEDRREQHIRTAATHYAASYQNRHFDSNMPGIQRQQFYSIDGEVRKPKEQIYPAERIQGTVVRELLPILMCPASQRSSPPILHAAMARQPSGQDSIFQRGRGGR